jgi:predicted phage terminase large subunit-like protein
MAVKPDFLGFAEHVMVERGQGLARHHRLLVSRLQRVADGGCDRLMVQMPPGSAKSTYCSVLFPAYFLSCYPGSQIVATAHTASLANHFGRGVRRVICDYGGCLDLKIANESRAAGEFMVMDGGAYFAAGVHGPITGRRADLVLIDDPVKSWAEAESAVFRDALHDWYRAELLARLKPKGRIVFVMTRWHEDDLAGRLMANGDHWETLMLPALAEAGDVLGRAVGEALWPEWQDRVALDRLRGEMGERSFAAMYQQRPRPPESSLFDVAKIDVLEALPGISRSVRAWDLAATVAAPGRDPDYTVGLKLGLTLEKKLVVQDLIRIRANAGEVTAMIVQTATKDGKNTVIGLPKDPGQAGAAQVDYLTRLLGEYTTISSPETGSKIVRAMPAAAQIDQRQVSLLAAPWNENFIRELEAFPDSKKDDQVDAFSRAVGLIFETAAANARRQSLSLIGR